MFRSVPNDDSEGGGGGVHFGGKGFSRARRVILLWLMLLIGEECVGGGIEKRTAIKKERIELIL